MLTAFLGAAKFSLIAGIAAVFLLTCSEHGRSGATWCMLKHWNQAIVADTDHKKTGSSASAGFLFV
ncbi:MAG: hypothetical protein JKY26_00470 [Pseudomonas sp.]|nr:hypothetical protein [Pseudomonas sp.]